MDENVDKYLYLKLQYDSIKIEEKLKSELESDNLEIPYDIYYLVMNKIENSDVKIKRRTKPLISRGKLEFIKLLIASAIAIVMGFWLMGTGVGDRPKVFSVVEKIINGKKVVQVGVRDQPRDIPEGSGEDAVYQAIKEQYHIQIPQFGYLPEGVKYHSHRLEPEPPLSATIAFMNKDGFMFYYQIFGKQRESSMGMFWDDKLIEEYQLMNGDQLFDVRRHEIEETKQTTMVAQFYDENTFCVISGIMEQEEFNKVINNLVMF